MHDSHDYARSMRTPVHTREVREYPPCSKLFAQMGSGSSRGISIRVVCGGKVVSGADKKDLVRDVALSAERLSTMCILSSLLLSYFSINGELREREGLSEKNRARRSGRDCHRMISDYFEAHYGKKSAWAIGFALGVSRISVITLPGSLNERVQGYSCATMEENLNGSIWQATTIRLWSLMMWTTMKPFASLVPEKVVLSMVFLISMIQFTCFPFQGQRSNRH